MTTRGPLDLVFRWGVIAKGVYGFGELIVGVFLVFTNPAALQLWANLLTQEKLSEDPDSLVALSLMHLVNGLTVSAVIFASVYLIVHGLVKIGLLWAVLMKKYAVYPWAIGILIAFIGYQSYKLCVGFSIGLLALTIFDAVIVGLTWREYRHHSMVDVVEPLPDAVSGSASVSEGDAESRPLERQP